jgi:hypothetical protein
VKEVFRKSAPKDMGSMGVRAAHKSLRMGAVIARVPLIKHMVKNAFVSSSQKGVGKRMMVGKIHSTFERRRRK